MPLFRSPQEAIHAPAEEFLYLACLRDHAPDFLAVVDTEDGKVVHELPMPNPGDELHHFGWNRCSSACHGPDRSHLIVPGFRSSRFHIVNVADDPRRPRIEKVIEPEEVVAATGYTRPHTIHCMPGDNIVVSMLGDADGNGAGGFAVLDAQTFELKGRWENGGEVPGLNYDFWYQPRKNALVSSEFGEPNAYEPGFDLADVEAGRYGQRIHFWNLETRELEQTVDLGEKGLVPLEPRWLPHPARAEADRTTLAGRRDREAGRCRPRTQRRPEHDPALLRRPPSLRQQLALLDVGRPVLPGAALVAAPDRLRPERRHGDRPQLLRRLPRPPRRARTCSRDAPPGRRLHDGGVPVILGHVMGLPIEESVLQFVPAGAATVTVIAYVGRARLGRLLARRRRD